MEAYINKELMNEVLDDLCVTDSVWSALNDIPAADVKKVIHAKWEWHDVWDVNDGFGSWMMLCCSNCLESEGARENAEYCPNCGAIMDLE